jgi:DNA-binding beta-propeller fold protein YncE
VLLSVAALADQPPAFVLTWGEVGSGDGQFIYPHGLGVDDDGYIYVADYDNERIQKFSANGIFLAAWGDSGTGDGEFRWPEDLAIHGDTVYVTDFGNRRVQKFLTDGTFLGKWGSPGSGNGQFESIGGIAVDGDGCVYVSDAIRIQKFRGDGTFVMTWGQFGQGDGDFTFRRGSPLERTAASMLPNGGMTGFSSLRMTGSS